MSIQSRRKMSKPYNDALELAIQRAPGPPGIVEDSYPPLPPIEQIREANLLKARKNAY